MSSSVETDVAAIDPEIREQALEWQVTLWSGEVTAEEQNEFQRWLTANPRHEREWLRIQPADQARRALSAPGASQALRALRRHRARRRLLRAFGFVASAGIATYAVRESPPWKRAMADIRTNRGERREATLPDGTTVTLNTATSLDIRFDSRHRRVVLNEGEIFVVTASDATRPFIVETRYGTIRALGTRFSVRQDDDTISVVVLEHAVEISPRAGSLPIRLTEGQQTSFNARQVATPRAARLSQTAWTRGLLVAERQRLADVVAEVGRYRAGVVRCDPAVAELVVSGVYNLEDTDRILANLSRALPIHVRYRTRYWVTVGPRSNWR